MPVNHGLFLKSSGSAIGSSGNKPACVFRYGVWRIFDALYRDGILASVEDRRRAAELHHHFATVCERLLFSAKELDEAVQLLVSMHQPINSHPVGGAAVYLRAETRADHLLTYLCSAVDDIAMMIVLATGYVATRPGRVIDSMGKLRKSEYRAEPVFAPVLNLLVETDDPLSWWAKGFATGSGARQLLVHNQHVVSFQLSTVHGGRTEARALIYSAHAESPFACTDFFALLREVQSGLFEWLDRVEMQLAAFLSAVHPSWKPKPSVPTISLPSGWPIGKTRLSAEYWALPLCDDSEPLPWEVEVVGPA